MAHFTGWSYAELIDLPLLEMNRLYKAASDVYRKMNTPAQT